MCDAFSESVLPCIPQVRMSESSAADGAADGDGTDLDWSSANRAGRVTALSSSSSVTPATPTSTGLVHRPSARDVIRQARTRAEWS